MVADGAGIVAHVIEQFHLYFAMEKVVIDRALRKVATVEEQHAGMERAQAVDECGPSHEACLPGHVIVREVVRYGFYTRVGVVGVGHEDASLRLGRSCRDGTP